MTWDWTLLLLVDAGLLILGTGLLIGLFLRDLWRQRYRETEPRQAAKS